MNSVNEIGIKNHMHYILDKMINIKNLDLNKIKVHENSYKKKILFTTLAVR